MSILVHELTDRADVGRQNCNTQRNVTVYVLKIDSIQSNSSDPSLLHEIEITSWSWGESQTPGTAGGGGTSKVKPQDFQFTMPINRASPQLALACAVGRHFKKAILTGHNPHTVPSEFLKMIFTDVVVTAFQTEATIASIDRVAIAYGAIDYEYFFHLPDGSTNPVGAYGLGFQGKSLFLNT